MPEFRYPQYDLDQSIEVARKITDRGSGATVTGHELAAFLGYSGVNNGAYLNRVAAARMFGLLQGNSKALNASALAEQIIHPDHPNAEAQGRLVAFRSVPLFDAFLAAYGGRELPEEQLLMNGLVGRFRVPQKEARGILTRLMASAEQAGLFSVAGAGRMIEPSYSSSSSSAPPSASKQPEEAKPSPMPLPDPGARRFPKIIDGALDLMPAGPPWEESEYVEWLSFFDQACRVYYRIRRGGELQG